ncbi:MAG TPA: N-6 DNA methylase [Anaeromyxobacteraceae bacterium]|nr:N-6 DNA methylase [Anaeromyxobacteraceae bacterium]
MSAGRATLPAEDGARLGVRAERELAGRLGAVFTGAAEAEILSAVALAHAAHRRGGPAPEVAAAALLGEAPAAPSLAKALDGLAVLDPACGAGALLVAAEHLARRAGARLRLAGIEVAEVAARAARTRLAELGADAVVRRADALAAPWPGADLVLMNPPFVRHEALPPPWKDRAVRLTGLPRQADLSAHFALLALRHAPVAGIVLPRGLETSRSAARFRDEARARGGTVLHLRSRAAGSFRASVHTALAVWVEGARDRPRAEASVPLADLAAEEVASLLRGVSSRRIRRVPERGPSPRGVARVGTVCEVRFGVKTGANGFFHLRLAGGGRFRSVLCGEVELAASDVAPLLAGLKEAVAPEVADPRSVLFRPRGATATARAYVARGEALGLHRRPTCAGRSPWWALAAGRCPAPVLYPAKVGARAFAFLNQEGLLEDKKWHALFPRRVEGWVLALVLSSTPVRLAVEEAARQLTGAQAIADIDCAVLAGAPFPEPAALAPLAGELAALRRALATDPVTTDLAAMLDRPGQRELDALAGRALALSPREVARGRRALLARVAERLEHAARVREGLLERTGDAS